MRVLFTSANDSTPWGGSEVLWVAAADAAMDAGHEVAVLQVRWPEVPRPIADLEARGAKLFLRPLELTSRWTRGYYRRIYPLPALARWKPDVICVNEGTAFDLRFKGYFGHLMDACERPPYVVIVQHSFEYRTDLAAMDWSRDKLHDFYSRAHRVAFVAEQNLRATERQIIVDLPNACVVQNPVNLTPDRAGTYLPVPWSRSDEARMASVARLAVETKGQDVLLDLLGQEVWRNRLWCLRLYGKGGDRRYLEELARARGIADRVEFRGHVEDIRKIWEQNEILLLPSRSEGTPLSLIEAMLCGRPAVVTDVGGNWDWISEPGTGYRAEWATVRSFGMAMERAWAGRASWETQGLNAHREASRRRDPNPGASMLRLLTDAVPGQIGRSVEAAHHPEESDRLAPSDVVPSPAPTN